MSRSTATYPINTDLETVEEAVSNLTENGKKFMTLVGSMHFDFFDDGIVEGGGNWGDHMAWQMAGLVGKNRRSNGGIMGATKTAGLWTAYEDEDQKDMWWQLTALGADVANYLAGKLETAEEPQVHDVTMKTGVKWTYLYAADGSLIAEVRNDQARVVLEALAQLATDPTQPGRD